MKQFFKIIFGSALGFFVANVLLLFAIITVLSVAASGSKDFKLKDNSVFRLKIEGEIVDRSQNNFLAELFSSNNVTQIGLDDILKSIAKAKANDQIKGILLDVNATAVGVSSAREIRNALLDFKESGKFIVANGGIYSQTAYYIASVADNISLNPSGMLEFRGLASTPVFYKNALEKLGIEVQLVKVGTYKSFAERFTNTEMSDENREQVSGFLHSVWSAIIDDISASRNISKEDLNRYADEMMMFQPAEKAVQYRLVDSLMYNDEIGNLLASKMDLSSEKDIEYVTLDNMMSLPEAKKSYDKEKIAVVYMLGDIDGGSSFGNDGINSDRITKILREINDDDNIKAVVVRINSPGGSAYGSEQIWRALSLVREQKPVIVSMGDYAASGGYYIACASDSIVAQPTTLTGSICIFGLIPNIKGLTDKLGIDFDVVRTNEKSDMPSLNRAFTPQERDLMQAFVNRGYDLFIKRCAEGRNMAEEEIRAVAEGRVWSGEMALQLGLVDELGGLEKAIGIASEKAGIESYRLVEYPKKKDFLATLMESFSENIQTKALKMQMGENYRHYIKLKEVEQIGKIQAILPFDIVMK